VSSAQLLLSILLTDILPIFVVAGVGFLLARHVSASAKAFSSVTFNALAPCLVFNLLVTASISVFDFGRMALFTILVIGVRGLLARIVAIPLRLDRAALASFLLVTMFSNSGNFGLPVVLFAFGREALTFATVYFVTASVLSYTLGVFVAASGRTSAGQALLGIARVPTIYAVLAAMLVLALGVRLPLGVMRPIEMLSDAALPLMILILGMQLGAVSRPRHPAAVAAAVVLSLLVSPALAFVLAAAMTFSGPAFQAGVLQASMPAAVVTTVLALQFDLDAEFPTAVVVVSTLLSPLTVTLLIAYLRW
jgi:malate permease and related proteins